MKQRSLWYAFFLSLFLLSDTIHAQKKVLDHSVYDTWESLGEKKISSDGQWVAFTVDPQEGDGKLIVKNPSKSIELEYSRGYAANFSSNSHFLVFKIKPNYKDVRDAKIKKKKADDFPKDSLGIIDLSTLSVEKIASVTSFKLTEKNNEFLAYLS
ncbi:MAG: hypothetical protein RLY11_372, partial [Bacteroidota bacterium]